MSIRVLIGLSLLAAACSSTSSGLPPIGDAGGDSALVDGDAGPVVAPEGGDASAMACHVEATGPMPPSTADVTYSYGASSAPVCFSNALCQVGCNAAQTFVEGLLACTPTQGGYFWALGSAYVRVHGIAGGACVFDIAVETEGDTKYSRCQAALPVTAWKGLSYVNDPAGTSAPPDLTDGLVNCQTISDCNATIGRCFEADGGIIDAGPPADAPACPALPTPPDWC